jgi:hypothetical protein
LLAQVYENRETETCQIIQSKTPQKSWFNNRKTLIAS